MNRVSIKDLTKQTLTALQSYGLNHGTIKSYKYNGFSKILKYFESKEEEYFNTETLQEFVLIEMKRLELGEFTARHFRKLRKAAALLKEYHDTGMVRWAYLNNRCAIKVNEYFSHVLTDYLTSKEMYLSENTVKILKSHLLKFLEFIEMNRQKINFTKVSLNDIRDFIQFISVNHKSSLKNDIYSLKSFIMFLKENCIIEIDLMLALQRPAVVRKQVLLCFSHNEVESILNQIVRTTSEGKRDYALLFLAVHTGLRSIDIVNLKLTDIDWKNNEINIVQRKTNRVLILPLEPDTGTALAEYILYGRPNSDAPYIFLRICAPHNKLSDVSSAGNILRKYRNMAGIAHNSWDGKSFHALRRSLGTWMLEAGVEITTISQVLGHQNLDSAKPYLNMDCERLIECALGLQGIEVTKEELQ